MEKRIELSELELAVLKRDVKGLFFPPEQTDEENRALTRVIEKADKLMEELDAYDELDVYPDMNMMKWFLKKYREQEKADKEKR